MRWGHIGSDFSDFLKEEDIHEETNDIAIKRVITYQLEQEMKAQNITKTKMAQMMHTSRAVVNRLLSPDNKFTNSKHPRNCNKCFREKANYIYHLMQFKDDYGYFLLAFLLSNFEG